jgi:hypothetical protein
VTYTTNALRRDLERVKEAWEECQTNRDRDAIYGYLDSVFNLIARWTAEKRAIVRSRKALRLHKIGLPDRDEPFAAIIRCTSDSAKVDKRTRSKWSRVLRYVMQYKDLGEPLAQFIKRKGGINECATRFGRSFGRYNQQLRAGKRVK